MSSCEPLGKLLTDKLKSLQRMGTVNRQAKESSTNWYFARQGLYPFPVSEQEYSWAYCLIELNERTIQEPMSQKFPLPENGIEIGGL